MFPAIKALGTPHIVHKVAWLCLIRSLSCISSWIKENIWFNSIATAAGIEGPIEPCIDSYVKRQSDGLKDLPKLVEVLRSVS